jgi:ribonucleoside-diphosphate reductase alpha chain
MTVTDPGPAGHAQAQAQANPQANPQARMRVSKRNGDTEPVDVNKIVRAVERCADGLAEVDPLRVATKTISGLYDGATTAELDRLSIRSTRGSRRGCSPPTSTRKCAGRASRRSASRSAWATPRG